MKLKKISIWGFRSIREQSWEPGPLNVLIGPNNSGKSNFLRALELLQQAATGNLDEAVLRLGGIGALAWDRQCREIKWTIEAASDVPNTRSSKDTGAIRYDLSLAAQGLFRGFRVQHELLRSVSSRGGIGFKFFERKGQELTAFDLDAKANARLSGQLEETQTFMSKVPFLFSFPAVSNLYSFLKDWGIYHDFLIHQDSPIRKSTITRNESRLSANGQNLIAVLHTLYTTNRQFRTYVVEAMRAAFGMDFEDIEFPPAEDQRIQMKVRWRSLKNSYSAADLPDGLLQFLMLIAVLGNPATGTLIAIDEPEIFLHPRMLPIIAELAAEASERNQVILTTHSPQLLTALGDMRPTTTVVENVKGETLLSTLDPKELKRWLDKYSLGELFLSGELEALR